MPGLADPIATIDVVPLSIRAEVQSINAETRTAELVFSTGAAVDRFDWLSGKRYREVLSMKKSHVRLDRLNAGAPLLDSHSAYTVGDQLGAIVRGTARIENGQAVARVRFSKRAAVEPIFQDVQDGIISSVSVGYRVHRFEETEGRDGGPATRLATDWEPFEVSLVSMPADVGAKVRDGDRSLTNSCVVVCAAADADRRRQFLLARAKGV